MSWIPENWNRTHRDYAKAGSKRAGHHGRVQRPVPTQRERFDERLRADQREMKELLK